MARMTAEEKAARAAARAAKKAADKAAADAAAAIAAEAAEAADATDAEEGDDDKPRGMAKTLAHYKAGYELTITASGSKSLSNGDELARALEGMDHDAVMRVAEDALELGRGFLVAKYERLNNGAKRMNSGNRLRGALKRGTITMEEISAHIGSGDYSAAA